MVVLAALAGAGCCLLASGRTWAVVVGRTAGLPVIRAQVTGRTLTPVPEAAGLVGLAALAGWAALRGRGRRLVGLVVGLAGAATVAATAWLVAALPAQARAAVVDRPLGGVLADGAVTGAGWPAVAVLGGALLLVGGGLAAVARHPPAATRAAVRPRPGEADPLAAWEALDRGEDPTLG